MDHLQTINDREKNRAWETISIPNPLITIRPFTSYKIQKGQNKHVTLVSFKSLLTINQNQTTYSLWMWESNIYSKTINYNKSTYLLWWQAKGQNKWVPISIMLNSPIVIRLLCLARVGMNVDSEACLGFWWTRRTSPSATSGCLPRGNAC